MYSVDELRNVEFRTGRGYKAEDVDIFVDQVAADYEIFLREMSNLKSENERLTKENQENANNSSDQSGWQNILISAQRFADQIVAEAKQKAEEILTDANKTALETKQQTEADKENCKAHITKANETAQAEIEKLLKDGAKKAEAMKTAANDSVDRQQLLFDKLKTEIVDFKSQIMDMYKEHLSLLSQIPDEVPFDAKRAAQVAAVKVDEAPDFDAMIAGNAKQEEPAEPAAEEAPADEPAAPEETAAPAEEENSAEDETGFTRIMDIPSVDEE